MKLKLTFSFDPTPYYLASHAAAQDPSTSRANRIKGDKATFEKVYYQLIQPDVGFTVSTSIDDSWTSSVDKAPILDFVKAIYQYLDGSLNDTSLPLPTPYTQEINASAITIKSSFIFPVTVEMGMARDLALVLDDLKQSGNQEIQTEYETVQRAPATLSPKFESNTITVTAGQSLTQLAIAASLPPTQVYTAVDLLLANSNHSGLLNAATVLTPNTLSPVLDLLNISEQDWAAYLAQSPRAITIQSGESPRGLAKRFRTDMEEKLNRTVNFTVSDLAAILADHTSVLTGGAEMLIGGLSLRSFAQHFQAVFPGLRLAVSQDRQTRTRSGISQQPLYAVRLGANGITYDIQEGQPTYYAIPPLTNVLLSGEVPIHNYAGWKGGIQDNADLTTLTYSPESENSQFDAIDLNVMARNFLVALESFLDPATSVPAYRLFSTKVDSILRQKADLAQALSDDILPVLDKDSSKTTTPQFLEAKEAIRQELLVNLLNGYDIETIVQFDVTVTVDDELSALNWGINLSRDSLCV